MDPDTAFELGLLPGTTGQVDASSAFPVAGQAGQAIGSGTGRFGLTPLATTGVGTLQDAVNSVWAWLNAPLSKPMSPTGIFLLVGAVLIAVVLWNLILYHIRIAAESL